LAESSVRKMPGSYGGSERRWPESCPRNAARHTDAAEDCLPRFHKVARTLRAWLRIGWRQPLPQV